VTSQETGFCTAKKRPPLKSSTKLPVPTFAVFALIFTAIWLLHITLLRLPYFWDEAGYYIPAARDLWLKHQLIPSTTVSSGHPPLVMAWLAFWWKFSGYAPAVTRTAMLLVAAFGLTGVFRLARQVSNTGVALAATALTAIYPVWFAQSSLAHLDVAAAAFTFWGLASYLNDHRWRAVAFFALAGVTKETAIIAPLALFAYELLAPLALKAYQLRMGSPQRLKPPTVASTDGTAEAVPFQGKKTIEDAALPFPHPGWKQSLALLISAVPLAGWFVYHHARTGVFFGNPEFFRYNVAATASPVRIALALVQRFWHAFGYLNLFVLVAIAGAAMLYAPLRDDGEERKRIAISVQAVFATVVVAYIAMLSVVGGAVIARYMLPAVPLVIIVCVSTLRRRLSWWKWACAAAGLTFVLALFVNPPYRISPEDNLSYADYVRLHHAAAQVIRTKYPEARILTAWPASDELTRPWLGYVGKPHPVLRIDNFSLAQLEPAAQARDQYQLAYLFSTKLDPPNEMFGAPFWIRLQERYFDYHRDVPPEFAASMLGGRIVYQAQRGGEWVAIVEIERVEDATVFAAYPSPY
jgi:hypothetical protein